MPKPPSKSSSAPSQRQLRVGESIRHALAEILTQGRIHDDVIAAHVITVSEVRMSSDMKLATAYVMPLGGADIEPVLAALERNSRFVRGELARAVNLKYAPQIRFRADDTFEAGNRIDRLLDSPAVRRDTGK